VKTAIALAAASAIILGLALWIVWPSAPNQPLERMMAFAHRSEQPPPVIEPPFGFHWGDSMARVEALLGYSSAEIVMRMATGKGETWIVEGLIQPGLKNAYFVFEKNALVAVELQCQYDAWPLERYRDHIEELRKFFDGKYGEKQRTLEGGAKPNREQSNLSGYSWRLAQTSLTVSSRSDAAPAARRMSVTWLAIQYRFGATPADPASSASINQRWGNTVVSSIVAKKVQPNADRPPEGSDLAITNVKLLNTSDARQSAYTLRLAIRLQPEAIIDPTKTVVEVNFYDTLASGEVVLTDANVSYDWPSRRDWKQSNPENLGVSYIRKGDNPPQDPSARRFFGYIVTVYHDGRLESVRAEPIALINLFPVRTFVSLFENAQGAAARGDFTAAASMYRRAADQGNLFALENLAWFYARGKGVDKNYHLASIFYERAALQNTPRALNALAWFLATCEDDSIRNGAEAIRHATTACELSYWQEWKYIDTLAASWAETGDFKRAIEYEQQAQQLKGLDDATRKKIDDHVALYRKRQSVRE
jgi:hypothetical protein